MITRLGVWQIGKYLPRRVNEADVDLEEKLEEWIESDPSMLQHGLIIVSRQLQTEGGPLDLLAIDQQGRWVVIEIKRGTVRRETIAQAIDYASCIRRLPEKVLCEVVADYFKKHRHGSIERLRKERPEAFDATDGERDVEMIVVGTGRDRGLDRMVEFMKAKSGVSISVVTFQVFRLDGGKRVLVRELTESDAPQADQDRSSAFREKALRQSAAAFGMGKEFDAILSMANRHGLRKRITNKSVMFAPPADARRVLFLVYADRPMKDGGLRTWVNPEAFKEFFGLKPHRVVELLCHDRSGSLVRGRVPKFTRGLDELLREGNGES
jgi:Holliday junction resolvase-like predicted endonuclease